MKEQKRKPYRWMPWAYSILAVAIIGVVSAVAQISGGGISGYITGWNTSTDITYVNATYNNTTVNYNVVLQENGSRVCTVANGLCVTNGTLDGNNYTTGMSVNQSGGSYTIQATRNGAGTLLANFTTTVGTVTSLTEGLGINLTPDTITSTGSIGLINLEACDPVNEYSVWNGSDWDCDNDGSGSGTVTFVNVSTQSSAVINVTPSAGVTTSGTFNFQIPDATVTQNGFATATQITSLNLKALAGNCAGSNSTHVNVTMNATTAGVQCVAVALNPGVSSVVVPVVNVTGVNVTNGTTHTITLYKDDGSTMSATAADLDNITTAISFEANVLTLTRSGSMATLLAYLPNNSINLAFANLTSVPGFGYSNLTSVAVVNVTGVNVSNGSINTVTLYKDDGTTMSATFIGKNATDIIPSRVSPIDLDFWHCASTSNFDPLFGAQLNSGTATGGTGNASFPGICDIRDSTTASGGYKVGSATQAFMLRAGDNFTVTWTQPPGKAPSVRHLYGFQNADSLNEGGGGWDGCIWLNTYGNWSGSGNMMHAKCMNNGVITGATSNYTYTNDTWYRQNIYVASSNLVIFTVYNTTNGNQLAQYNITSNIPTTRPVGISIIAGQTTTDAAGVVVRWDRLTYSNNNDMGRQ